MNKQQHCSRLEHLNSRDLRGTVIKGLSQVLHPHLNAGATGFSGKAVGGARRKRNEVWVMVREE